MRQNFYYSQQIFWLTTAFCLVCLSAQAQEIPEKIDFLDLHLRIDEQAQKMLKSQVRSLTESKISLKRQVQVARRFFPLMQKVWKKEGLPQDLSYLSLANNPLKDSIVFWFGLPKHLAARLKLEQNNEVNEYQNVVLVTQKIALYLKENGRLFQKHWLAVLLSYELPWDEVEKYLKIGKILPIDTPQAEVKITAETHPFILKMIALKIALGQEIKNAPESDDDLIVLNYTTPKTLQQIAQEYLISVAKLKRYNFWLKTEELVTNKNYPLIIPLPAKSPSSEMPLLAQEPTEKIYTSPPVATMHTVKQGETLFKIAKQYGTTLQNLYALNNIDANHKLHIGQQIIVYISGENIKGSPVVYPEVKIPKPNTAFLPEAVVQNTVFHTVAKGENLYTIAKKYNVLASEIVRANKLENSQVQIGQQLRIVKTIPQKITPQAIPNTPAKPTTLVTNKNNLRTISPKQVPREMTLLDIRVKFTEKAQMLIQKDISMLIKNNKYFHEKLERANWYAKLIEEILEEQGVPTDFKYLPIQESTLLPNVVSVSNAVGYWQFKEVAAREVGLRVDNQVDERLNIIASTEGAAKYLKRNNLYFRNWIFTLLSYNMGFAGAKKFMEENYDEDEVMDVKNFVIDEHMHWYVRKFIAHKIAFEAELGKDSTNRMLVPYYKATNKSLKQIADENQVALQDLIWHNQWLKTAKVPANKPYTIILPLRR
ncbi:MAG: LysM peptidoglycan-binding domain-containing protein [Microscillaceae bacterium]|nr:LysM peptidoglycan-binding domain-containing protein [Microscillaceae bacterium]MDW8459703.1 LysM peptidoglycan-binding domain-containing protein [Cytophagales bacterium]